MKTEHALWMVVLISLAGIVWFGMKPKVCIDKDNGDARLTHRLFPCKANEQAQV